MSDSSRWVVFSIGDSGGESLQPLPKWVSGWGVSMIVSCREVERACGFRFSTGSLFVRPSSGEERRRRLCLIERAVVGYAQERETDHVSVEVVADCRPRNSIRGASGLTSGLRHHRTTGQECWDPRHGVAAA